MRNKISTFVARLVGASLALALPFAAMAQEADTFKAPVHHMSPPVGGSAGYAGAPAVFFFGGDAMLKREADAVRAPVHHQDPGTP